MEKWGLFSCSYCLQKIERCLSNGLRDKSCGCVRYELSKKSNTTHECYPFQHWAYN